MPLTVAAPLAVLLSITVAAIVVAQDWRHIHARSAAGLVLATLFGIPLGVLILTSPHQRIVRAVLGLLILFFALYSLIGRNAVTLKEEHRPLLLLAGFMAGILGGAYGMNGPPLVMYGSMRRWSPQHFRATLQAYFLPASVLGMAAFWTTGLWSGTVTRDYLLSLPVVAPAVLLGRFVNQRLSSAVFLKYVYAGLALTGGMLFLETLTHRR